jgi:hypothetical protein
LPAVVGTLDVELHEGAGQLLGLPRSAGLARAQPDDGVLDPQRLTRLHRQVAHNAVALVEQADHRDPLGHRGHARLRPLAHRLLRLRAALLLRLGALVALAASQRQRSGEDRDGAHGYSGFQAW